VHGKAERAACASGKPLHAHGSALPIALHSTGKFQIVPFPILTDVHAKLSTYERKPKAWCLQQAISALYSVDAVILHCAALIILTLPFSHSLLPLMLWWATFPHGGAVYSLIGRCFANNYP
jgi:hypothetical protein